MNSIKIIAEKYASKTCINASRFITYTNRLTEIAGKQEGFILSSSYLKEPIDFIEKNPLTIITISEWKHFSHWEDWENSKERKNIYEEYKDVIHKEEFNRIFNKRTNDIFLF